MNIGYVITQIEDIDVKAIMKVMMRDGIKIYEGPDTQSVLDVEEAIKVLEQYDLSLKFPFGLFGNRVCVGRKYFEDMIIDCVERRDVERGKVKRDGGMYDMWKEELERLKLMESIVSVKRV